MSCTYFSTYSQMKFYYRNCKCRIEPVNKDYAGSIQTNILIFLS